MFPQSKVSLRPQVLGWCLLIFCLGLLPRVYSALTVGWDWDHPGSFTLVNFDEGGSCRAALGGFDYSTFVGRQTIAIAAALGDPPPAGIVGRASAVKAYCHSAAHLRVARLYSALSGALTPLLIVAIGLCLWPGRPEVGLTGGALLALSGFHISESHSGTVDAPSVFFIYLFLAVLLAAVRRDGTLWRYLALPLLALAVWAKFWVFALLALCVLLPGAWWAWCWRGWQRGRLALALGGLVVVFGCATNTDFPAAAYPLLALFYLLVPWRELSRGAAALWLLLPWLVLGLAQLPPVMAYTTGSLEGRFGQGYGAIGWHKWLRNGFNLPAVLVAGLGLPAFLCLLAGMRALWRDPPPGRWLACFLPLLAFALFMLVPAIVTYYRHYLPLLPAAALLAALGFWQLAGGRGRWLLLPFLAWPALLALDIEQDFHRDPRIALRGWYSEQQPERVLASYYVNPPSLPGLQQGILRPAHLQGDGRALRRVEYLVLSENWYDTAFANELNGPLVNQPAKLVKTTPAQARFYRRALAGELDYLVPAQVLPVTNFMPELVLHKRWYGTFQLFVGDIRILRVVPGA